MNKTNFDFAPLQGDDAEPTYLEKYVGVKVVAMPNGESANDMLLKASLSAKAAATGKSLVCLATARKWFMKLLERLGYRHAVIDKAPAEVEEKSKELPAKFQFQELCGRRITGVTQLKLLQTLVNNSLVTRRELDDSLGVVNSPEVVRRMVTNCGWQIGKLEYWDREEGDTRKRRRFHYILAGVDWDIAKVMLRKADSTSSSASGVTD